MKIDTTFFPFCFILMWLPITATAQQLSKYLTNEERFNAGVVMGMNVTQMDGDYFTGYDKYGLVGGIKGIVRLTPRLDFNMEFLYSKKGAKIFTGNMKGNDFIKDRIVDLTYVEVPFTVKWLVANEVKSWHLEAGIVYARLLNQRIEENFDDPTLKFSYASIVDDFKKDEISAMGGVGYSWNRRWSLHGRFIYGITRFYEEESVVSGQRLPTFSLPVAFLRNYHLSLQLSYVIFN